MELENVMVHLLQYSCTQTHSTCTLLDREAQTHTHYSLLRNLIHVHAHTDVQVSVYTVLLLFDILQWSCYKAG